MFWVQQELLSPGRHASGCVPLTKPSLEVQDRVVLKLIWLRIVV